MLTCDSQLDGIWRVLAIIDAAFPSLGDARPITCAVVDGTYGIEVSVRKLPVHELQICTNIKKSI